MIAGRVPGRTDNQVKNHWNTHLSKKLKLGVKKAKRKVKASSQTIVLPREELEERLCIPTSESMNSCDHDDQLPSNFITGESAEDKAMKDGSQTAVYVTGMWNENCDSSFCISDDYDLNNLQSCFLVEPIQEYFSLDFVWDTGL